MLGGSLLQGRSKRCEAPIWLSGTNPLSSLVMYVWCMDFPDPTSLSSVTYRCNDFIFALLSRTRNAWSGVVNKKIQKQGLNQHLWSGSFVLLTTGPSLAHKEAERQRSNGKRRQQNIHLYQGGQKKQQFVYLFVCFSFIWKKMNMCITVHTVVVLSHLGQPAFPQAAQSPCMHTQYTDIPWRIYRSDGEAPRGPSTAALCGSSSEMPTDLLPDN